MDGRRSDGEEALDVGFGGRPSEGERIGMNKGQVLALLVGKFLKRGVHATWFDSTGPQITRRPS
jgi:hypothetical protein